MTGGLVPNDLPASPKGPSILNKPSMINAFLRKFEEKKSKTCSVLEVSNCRKIILSNCLLEIQIKPQNVHKISRGTKPDKASKIF